MLKQSLISNISKMFYFYAAKMKVYIVYYLILDQGMKLLLLYKKLLKIYNKNPLQKDN